ncbi:MAG: hypothetical protein IT236_17285 [Bacteroidia bacterium]|nr:hypothetical protein [Bacteroidia bacterium]
MKKILFSAALLLSAAFVNAQEGFASFTIKMNMKMEGLPAEYAAYGEQEISSMMFTTVSFTDGNKHTSLTEAMGNKTGFVTTKEEMEKIDKKDKTEPKPKIEYTSEKKTIAGYECTKAIVTTIDKEKKEAKVNVWFTEKIKLDPALTKQNKGMFDLGEIKGTPLEIEIKQNADGTEIKVIITTTEVLTSPIADSFFVPNTEGYTMTTYGEWKDKMKAMGR